MPENTPSISTSIIQTTIELGYRKLFPIQEQVIPLMLQQKDIIAIAPTGTGKTASFVMPILSNLEGKKHTKRKTIHTLILVPTRELAVQIEKECSIFSKNLRRNINILTLIGGASIQFQIKNNKDVEILIATPGRLLEFIESNLIQLNNIEQFIIDEADKIFQLGFEKELNKILLELPIKKQVALFSATMHDKINSIKTQLNIAPQIIDINGTTNNTIEQIEQKAYLVAATDKGPFLRKLIKEAGDKRVLIFVSAQRTADNLVEKLKKHKIGALSIHGKKSQNARTDRLDGFKNGAIQVLVTTDLLGRGIHIESLPLVINYDLPRSPQDFIHRIGRTGRANETGKAITMLTADDVHHFQIIQKKMKLNIPIIEA